MVTAISSGKLAVVIFEKAMETYQKQDMMLPLVDFERPNPASMQNSNNVLWRNVQQHAPILSGFDLTGQDQTIIEETYPAVLGTPANDLVTLQADQMRDQGYWERRGEVSGAQQATYLNQQIASAIATQGSLFFRTNTTSGFTAIATARRIINERQTFKMNGMACVLNDTDSLLYANDLAGRQTLQGRPETTWKTGQIGQNVSEFDVYEASFLPSLTGGANPASTVTGNQSFAPVGGSVTNNTLVTNVDYRIARIPVNTTVGYNVGDKVQFANGGTAVQSVGLADKTPSGNPMTFTIVSIVDGTHVDIFPKPIAVDDPGLTALQAAYANINTRILNAATMDRVNIDATNRTNIFFTKDSVEVLGGTIPANLFAEFNGMQVIHDTMKNGQEMYMVYKADPVAMTFTYRLFTWWGITVKNPSACGCFVTY